MHNLKKRRDGIIKVISGDRFTPYSLARKLKATVILESSSFKKGKERYSLLMVDEAFRVFQDKSGLYLEKENKKYKINAQADDILDVLKYFSNQNPSLKQDVPFPCGGIGYLSFEFVKYCDKVKLKNTEDALGLPLGVFLFGHVYIIFDHYTDMIYLIGINYKEDEIDLEEALRKTEEKINDLNFNFLAQNELEYSSKVISRNDREIYASNVEKIKEDIVKGNIIQGVLSRRLEVETDMPAVEAYKRLRSTNPSPYLFYINFKDFELFGSSPEMHVKVHNRKAYINPIAGTIRRGSGHKEDKELEKKLLNDEKEKAEHLMLVDLARNDLGRFCKSGSVKIKDFMIIEKYSHVMHIVSNVEGDLKENSSGIDAIRATFPAGTVSGAPKIKAMEIINSIEGAARGFYSGLVGYVGPDDELDTCITIRSALKKDGKMYLQAGAGIVYDSNPEREYEETNEKLMALVKAIGLEV